MDVPEALQRPGANLGRSWHRVAGRLAPVPQPIVPKPSPNKALPKADVVVIAWTVDELIALADVLTPGFSRDAWYRYARNFDEYCAEDPSRRTRACRETSAATPIELGKLKVLCMKSELHMNQDGIEDKENDPGNATLPVKDFFDQIIEETGASYFITTGTAGSVYGAGPRRRRRDARREIPSQSRTERALCARRTPTTGKCRRSTSRRRKA
jgi:hypothetical protein